MWLRVHLLHFCQWCNGSFFGHGIRDSVWLFPFVEIFHLLGLGILGGTLLVLNLRLMRLGFRDQQTADMEKDFRPWMIGSLIVMLISGFLLFSTEAVKMYGNWGFRWKMLFLAAATVYTFTLYRKVVMADEKRVAPMWRVLVALVSIALWAGVGLGGRSIGYITTSTSSVSDTAQ
jgi:putative copper export protein